MTIVFRLDWIAEPDGWKHIHNRTCTRLPVRSEEKIDALMRSNLIMKPFWRHFMWMPIEVRKDLQEWCSELPRHHQKLAGRYIWSRCTAAKVSPAVWNAFDHWARAQGARFKAPRFFGWSDGTCYCIGMKMSTSTAVNALKDLSKTDWTNR